ncbi:ATP/GTP-binding protein [Kitasatospora sp. NPDC056783]|uniref:ATP/GTP-binding protein n=1 Tax=Kitasatospora sp. NPDC056783 TaxID=3345943 RepID=UPI0036911806
MIVWINRPFGGGKTTLTATLLEALPGAVAFDPEKVGYTLRETFPGKRRDFQDFPAWRPLVAQFAIHGHVENDGLPLLVPMSVLSQDYATEIHTAIRDTGVTLHHLLLHADPATIAERIEACVEYPGEAERSEKVRAFRRQKLDSYVEAHRLWLADDAEVIDTTHLTPAGVAEQALKVIDRP